MLNRPTQNHPLTNFQPHIGEYYTIDSITDRKTTLLIFLLCKFINENTTTIIPLVMGYQIRIHKITKMRYNFEYFHVIRCYL